MHHENADFFYALDKKVQKVLFEITFFFIYRLFQSAQDLAAAMADFVQDHALASKLLKPTHTG